MKRSKSDGSDIVLSKTFKHPRFYGGRDSGSYARPKNFSRSRSWVLTSRRDSNKKRLLRRVSESFIPNCVLVPNRSPVDELYKLFPQLPPGEKPLNDFSCALYKDILLQGKMIICSSCICFHSNIFGYETRVIIYFKNVLAIKREKTAFVVPNAISVQTFNKRYLFCSFLSRESSFKLLSRVWKHSVNEDDEMEGNLAPPINIGAGRKGISEEMLNFSSSSSYGSTIPRCLPERPHSSPPSFGGAEIGEKFVSPTQSPRDEDDCVFTVESESSEGSSSSITLDRISFANNSTLALRKTKSLSNISEAAALGHRFCFKNLQRIRNENIAKGMKSENKKAGDLCALSTKLKKVKAITTQKLSNISALIKSYKYNHPFVLAMSILVLLLAMFSLNLLVRINVITESLQTHQNNHDTKDNTCLKDLYQFKEGMHSANVERVRSILSINLETVSEVQKSLRELREKLNGQK